jgi:hypothetical protein
MDGSMKKAVLPTVVAAIVVAVSIHLMAGERVAVHVTPQVAFAPANVSVSVMVENDEHNRWVEIIADSTDFYRSSEVQLDGENAPRTTQVLFRDLPRGVYEVRAVVRDGRGDQVAATHTQLDIVSQ